MVFFLKNTSDFDYNYDHKKPLLVYHDMYKNSLPKIKKCEYVEFQKYKMSYSSIDYDFMYVVGLNRIITPSNRCDFINEYMQTMTPNIKKVSIDNSPFIGEPWRLWFHYSIANCGNFNISYSYAIETEWKKWFYYEKNDCRLSSDNICSFINNTKSDLKKLSTKFESYEVNNKEYNKYKEIVSFVFNKYGSPKIIINNLLKLTDNIFGTGINFNSYLGKDIKYPELGIYKFLVNENKRRMNIYNKVVSIESI